MNNKILKSLGALEYLVSVHIDDKKLAERFRKHIKIIDSSLSNYKELKDDRKKSKTN